MISREAQILRIIQEHVGKAINEPGLKASPFYRKHLDPFQPKGKRKTLSYPEFTQGVNRDKWQASPARIKACMDAAYACAAHHGLSKDDIEKSLQERRTPSEETHEALPAALRGAWLMVQYRGRRTTSSRQEFPSLDYRIAVLVYGADDKKNKRYFEIVGEQTFWRGSAWLLHEQVYFWADELERPAVKEALSMIMFKIDTDDDTDHHGILVSVAHGGPKGTGYPILASRVLLYRKPVTFGKIASETQ